MHFGQVAISTFSWTNLKHIGCHVWNSKKNSFHWLWGVTAYGEHRIWKETPLTNIIKTSRCVFLTFDSPPSCEYANQLTCVSERARWWSGKGSVNSVTRLEATVLASSQASYCENFGKCVPAWLCGWNASTYVVLLEPRFLNSVKKMCLAHSCHTYIPVYINFHTPKKFLDEMN